MKFSILTLFPDYFNSPLSVSLIQKAVAKGLVEVNLVQLRDFAHNKHRSVDDTPYGGGCGMLLRVDVLFSAWKSITGVDNKNLLKESSGGAIKTLLMSPQGGLFSQKIARDFTKIEHLILVCGHYEGVDQRFIELCVDEEVSIGDYILTGGEAAAAVVVECVTRLVPGVIGKAESIDQDSLEEGLLKSPQYTRPPVFSSLEQSLEVPPVLLSGNHEQIKAWRMKKALEVTQQKRPDLFQAHRAGGDFSEGK